MKAKLNLTLRVLFGLLFFASGLAGLLNLVPPPPDMPQNLKTFMDGMMATTYFMPLLKTTEMVCGLLLMLGQFVPLSLVILAPIVLNIFFVHAFMAPSGLALACIIGAMEIYLAFFAEPYASTIRQLFRRK